MVNTYDNYGGVGLLARPGARQDDTGNYGTGNWSRGNATALNGASSDGSTQMDVLGQPTQVTENGQTTVITRSSSQNFAAPSQISSRAQGACIPVSQGRGL